MLEFQAEWKPVEIGRIFRLGTHQYRYHLLIAMPNSRGQPIFDDGLKASQTENWFCFSEESKISDFKSEKKKKIGL